MYTRRLITWIAVAVLVAGALLVLSFPAARGFPLVAPENVEAGGLHGTVWRGGAESIRRGDAPPLRDVTWRVRPATLLQARPAWEVTFTYAGGDGNGELTMDRHRRMWLSDVDHAMPADGIGAGLDLPWLRFDGELHTRISRAVLVNGKLRELDADLTWDPAALSEPIPFPLGAIRGTIRPDATGNGHDIALTARDGVVEIAAGGTMDESGRYRMEYRLRKADSAPDEVEYLLEWIARRDGDEFVIRQRGRLGD